MGAYGSHPSGELKEFAPFHPLFEKEPGPEDLQEMNAILETVADPEYRVELKSLGAIIATRKFPDELIKQHLTLEFPMIRQSTYFSELIDEAINKGRLEGYTEGESRCEMKGEIKGRHLTLQKLLERKFGVLASEITPSLQQLGSAQLEALTMALFDLHSLDDFRAWMKNVQTGNLSAAQPLASA